MRRRMEFYKRHGITERRLIELESVALQYDWYRAEDKKLRLGIVDRAETGNKCWRPKDPTGNTAAGIADRTHAAKIRAIEESIKAAAPDAAMRRCLQKNVTRGIGYDKICPPCGENQFYAMRRAFFVELHHRI